MARMHRLILETLLSLAVFANASATGFCALFDCVRPCEAALAAQEPASCCPEVQASETSSCEPETTSRQSSQEPAEKPPCCEIAGLTIDQGLAAKAEVSYGPDVASLEPTTFAVPVFENAVQQTRPPLYEAHPPPWRAIVAHAPRAPPVACV